MDDEAVEITCGDHPIGFAAFHHLYGATIGPPLRQFGQRALGHGLLRDAEDLVEQFAFVGRPHLRIVELVRWARDRTHPCLQRGQRRIDQRCGEQRAGVLGLVAQHVARADGDPAWELRIRLELLEPFPTAGVLLRIKRLAAAHHDVVAAVFGFHLARSLVRQEHREDPQVGEAGCAEGADGAAGHQAFIAGEAADDIGEDDAVGAQDAGAFIEELHRHQVRRDGRAAGVGIEQHHVVGAFLALGVVTDELASVAHLETQAWFAVRQFLRQQPSEQRIVVAYHVLDHLIDVDHGDRGQGEVVGEIGDADAGTQPDHHDLRISLLRVATGAGHDVVVQQHTDGEQADVGRVGDGAGIRQPFVRPVRTTVSRLRPAGGIRHQVAQAGLLLCQGDQVIPGRAQADAAFDAVEEFELQEIVVLADHPGDAGIRAFTVVERMLIAVADLVGVVRLVLEQRAAGDGQHGDQDGEGQLHARAPTSLSGTVFSVT